MERAAFRGFLTADYPWSYARATERLGYEPTVIYVCPDAFVPDAIELRVVRDSRLGLDEWRFGRE